MRKAYIEYLRVAAMLSVVAIHVCIAALNGFETSSIWSAVFYLSIRNIFHYAVPVFFMISGALLLSPDREMPIKKLIHNYILKYGAVIILFGWAFAFLEEIFHAKTFSLAIVLRSFSNMLQGNSWDHMWYMYTLLGMMFVVPVLRTITEKITKQSEIIYMVITFMLFLSLIPCLEDIFQYKLGVVFPISSVYVLYMLLGYWMDQDKIKINRAFIIPFILFIAIIIIGLSYYDQLEKYDLGMLVKYNSPLIVAFSMLIFTLFKNMDIKNAVPQMIKKLGEYSFAVYLVHMFWINILYKLLKVNPFAMNCVFGFLLVYVMVVFASIISAIIMKKVPILKKII